MALNTLLKKAARFVLQDNKNPVYVTVGALAPGSLLTGRKIVVTGGSRGLGLAMAKAFANQGAEVLISGRNESALIEAQTQIPGKSMRLVYDVSDTAHASDFISRANEMLGGCDSLVCNAAISLHEKGIEFVSEEQFDLQFTTNIKGQYFLAKEFIKQVANNRVDSSLLFISSETGDQYVEIPYGLTKASLNSFVGALSRRYYRRGVRVNAIAPGVTESDMTASYADVSDGNYASNSAAGRVFLAEEVAQVAVFLLSQLSMCISGEVIHTNAGNHHKVPWE